MRITLVTGLAGSGKSTYANALAQSMGVQVVRMDDYRYVPLSNWVKRSLAEFDEHLETAILVAAAQNLHGDLVVEGAYHDAHDPEDARLKIINRWLQQGNLAKVVCIVPSLEVQIESLIERSIRRLQGVESTGACVETPQSRARLVIKNVLYYETNRFHLLSFVEECIKARVPVQSYDCFPPSPVGN